VDPGTHVLASLVLARALFPRRPWRFLLAVVLAGTLADIDLLSLFFGPSVYLSGRHTWSHSIAGILVIAVLCSFVGLSLKSKNVRSLKLDPAPAPFAGIFLAAFLSATMHVLMDLATPTGVAVLSPFRPTRFAWDLLPATDLWILTLLVLGILLPELFRLVSSEIGAKDKGPRGRDGALIALAFVCLYVGSRLVLHGDATALLDAHSYRGETPRRVATIPDSLSLFTWHGIIETTSQICTPEVPVTNAAHFDPETAVCVHKPDPSSALTAAEQTEAALNFLSATRFPKASIGVTDDGTEVVIRDMCAVVAGPSRFDLAARVLLDPNGRVTSQGIVWARLLRLR